VRVRNGKAPARGGGWRRDRKALRLAGRGADASLGSLRTGPCASSRYTATYGHEQHHTSVQQRCQARSAEAQQPGSSRVAESNQGLCDQDSGCVTTCVVDRDLNPQSLKKAATSSADHDRRVLLTLAREPQAGWTQETAGRAATLAKSAAGRSLNRLVDEIAGMVERSDTYRQMTRRLRELPK
jgi:hypothetical protein